MYFYSSIMHTDPVNWYRGQQPQAVHSHSAPHAQHAQTASNSIPETPAPVRTDRPSKAKEKSSFWQQIAAASKPLRIPTSFGDLGLVSLRDIYQSLLSDEHGVNGNRSYALNALQCLVHPSRLQDKDIVISLPPSAPFFADIVLIIIQLMTDHLPQSRQSDFHLQVLNQRFQDNEQSACFLICENILRGIACGEGKTSLILFDPRVKPEIFRLVHALISRPLSPNSFSTALIVLSRLSSGLGIVDTDSIADILNAFSQELEFIGPLLSDVTANPRFAFSSSSANNGSDDWDGHLKSIQTARDRFAFLSSHIPGHIYLFLYSFSLILCNPDDMDWSKLSTKLHHVSLLLFERLIVNFLPLLASLSMAVFEASLTINGKNNGKRQIDLLLSEGIKDGGYLELILMFTYYALLFKSHDSEVIKKITILTLRLMEYTQQLNEILENNSDHLERIDSDPLQLWSRSIDILYQLLIHHDTVVGETIVANGYFETIGEWLYTPSNVMTKRTVLVLEHAIDASFSAYS